MFDRLGETPLRIIMIAQELARSLGDSLIGTEHILLAELSFDSPAKSALNGFDVTYNDVLLELEIIRGSQNALPAEAELTAFTDRATRSLELAFIEAQELRHDSIGAEHLLLGILKLGQGIAIGILAKLGVSLVDLEIALLYQCSSVMAAPRPDVGAELLTQVAVWERLNLIAKQEGYEDLAQESEKHTRMYKAALVEFQDTLGLPDAASSDALADLNSQTQV